MDYKINQTLPFEIDAATVESLTAAPFQFQRPYVSPTHGTIAVSARDMMPHASRDDVGIVATVSNGR